MAETKGSCSEADYLNLETSSVTTAINEGDLVELDASGDVVKCSAAATTKFIGVAVTTVASRTSASQERITVQVGKIVKCHGLYDNAGTYQTAIAPGEKLIVGDDNAGTYTGQCVVHAPDSTDTDVNDIARVVGIALKPVASASATPTVIKVLLFNS